MVACLTRAPFNLPFRDRLAPNRGPVQRQAHVIQSYAGDGAKVMIAVGTIVVCRDGEVVVPVTVRWGDLREHAVPVEFGGSKFWLRTAVRGVLGVPGGPRLTR